MKPLLVLPSTTSHKAEPLLVTLEVFSRLGMRDLDLNLHHLMHGEVAVEEVLGALEANDQRVWIVSGGWCDFYETAPEIDRTFQSVARQVSFARQLRVDCLRLFYGRLKRDAYSPDMRRVIAQNIQSIADRYRDMSFVFENHDGASLDPEVCREILETVGRKNVRMNFDPVNFARVGVGVMDALQVLQPLIAHVHLKGATGTECCEFGTGDIDLTPVLSSLVADGYTGRFTVEYEGRFDRTIRLYESLRRARAAIERLAVAQ